MKPTATPLSDIERIHLFFGDPVNMPNMLVASEDTRYVWQQMSCYQQTVQVPRHGSIYELPERTDAAIGGISVAFSDGTRTNVDAYCEKSTLDALLVLQEGDIVFERYNTMRPFDKHNWFSCSKTLVGTSIALLEDAGRIDISQSVGHYVPELAGSEWDRVTIEETLDMATGLDATEHEVPDARTNPARGWFQWAASIGWFADEARRNLSPFEVLRTMQRTKPGHTAFEYNSINTYVLQVIVENISEMPISEFVGSRVWRRIGAQNDGYLGVNRQGRANAFGFMNSTLRDLGRYGMIFTPSGSKISDEPIVPASVVQKFQTGLRPNMYPHGMMGRGFQQAFYRDPGLSNRYQWDAVFPDGDFFKAGLGGQGLYVSPARDLVVVFFGTGTMQDEHHTAALARTVAQTCGNRWPAADASRVC